MPPTTLFDLVRVFGKIGLVSFGGPAAQIALMHRVLVDEKRWLTEAEFLRALSFCMLLPGPEAMQLATYAGWHRRGMPGGLIAGGLFVAPGAIVILALAAAYAAFGGVPLVAGLFFGVKACVVVIVIQALLRLTSRALTRAADRAIAVVAFVAIFAFAVPFPAIIAGAALVGALTAGGPSVARAPTAAAQGQMARGATIMTIGLTLWWGPLAALWLAGQDFLLELGVFFAKLAVVTFGGAYAVLGYMAQTVVQDFGWISTTQMIDALGLAETTPGPLILVTEFTAFLAGFGAGGWGLALAAALLSLWVTFVPCFLWIFVFAPAVAQIAGRPRLAAALHGITAAVVGVVANLTLWFALHVLFSRIGHLNAGPLSLVLPEPASLDLRALAVGLVAGVMLLRLHWPITAVLALSAVAGAIVAA